MPLLIPAGATWKYLLNTDPSSLQWPRYVGFGLDSPPSDATFAQPGYDDSAWADGQTVFHNNTWVEDFGPPDPLAGGTIYGGAVHDGNDKIWARRTGFTRGGDLHIYGVHDNVGAVYIDGQLLLEASNNYDVQVQGSNGVGAGPYLFFPSLISPGLHTFAFYGSGDGIFDQHWMGIEEGPSTLPLPVPDLSTALFAGARPETNLTTSAFIPGGV